MKKTLTLLSVILFLFCLVSCSKTADTIEIYTYLDFLSIEEKPNANYILKNDIDFDNNSFNFIISDTFTGSLDGKGYKLMNFTISDNSENSVVSIFKKIEQAKIEDVIIADFNIDLGSRVEVICSVCVDSELTGITVDMSLSSDEIRNTDEISIEMIGAGVRTHYSNNNISFLLNAQNIEIENAVIVAGIGNHLYDCTLTGNIIKIEMISENIHDTGLIALYGLSQTITTINKNIDISGNFFYINADLRIDSNDDHNTSLIINNVLNVVDGETMFANITDNISVSDVIVHDVNEKSTHSLSRFILSNNRYSNTYSITNNVVLGKIEINNTIIDDSFKRQSGIFGVSNQEHENFTFLTCGDLLDENFIETLPIDLGISEKSIVESAINKNCID